MFLLPLKKVVPFFTCWELSSPALFSCCVKFYALINVCVKIDFNNDG